MNKVYKVIFNRALQVYQVVSELAKGHSKASTPSNGHRTKKANAASYVCQLILMAVLLGGTSIPVSAAAQLDATNQKVINVAAGDITTSTSTDAVNGGQLYTVETALQTSITTAQTDANYANNALVNVAAALGGSAAYNATTGTWTAPSYSIGAVNISGGAINITDTSTSNIGTALTTLSDDIKTLATIPAKAAVSFGADSGTAFNGTAGTAVSVKGDGHNISTAVTSTTTAGTITVSMSDTPTFTSVTAGTGSNQVVISGSGVAVGGNTYITGSGINANNQKITNVASGSVAKNSTDAVNGNDVYELTKYFQANSTDTAANAKSVPGHTEAPDSIAIGPSSVTAGFDDIAMGYKASVNATTASSSTAIGNSASVTGSNSVALGTSSTVSSDNSIALGTSSSASSGSAVAIVTSSNATGGASLALGNGAYTSGVNDISMGTGAGVGSIGTDPNKSQSNRIAIGSGAGTGVSGYEDIAIGLNAGDNVTGNYNVGIGTNAGDKIQGDYNTALGYGANSTGASGSWATSIGANSTAASGATALGYKANASTDAVVLGNQASAGANGVAIGMSAISTDNSIAIGNSSLASSSESTGNSYITGLSAPTYGVVSVGGGSSNITRRIVNVADGSENTDAVNVEQLKAAQQSVATLIGGGTTVQSNGQFSSFTVTDTSGTVHTFSTIQAALAAFSSGTINILPASAIQYSDSTDANVQLAGTTVNGKNVGTTISNVATATQNDQAVNLGQTTSLIAGSKTRYFSVNDGGTQTGNYDDSGATAADAIAVGTNATATKVDSISVGAGTSAQGLASIVIGNAIGTTDRVAAAYGQAGIAIGSSASSAGDNSIAIGTYSYTNSQSSTGGKTSDDAIAIGYYAQSTDDNTIALGTHSTASGGEATAIGTSSKSTGSASFAIGVSSWSSGTDSFAEGTSSSSSGNNTFALGKNTDVAGTNTFALGEGGKVNATNEVGIASADSGLISAPLSSDVNSTKTILEATDTYAIGNGNGTIRAADSQLMGNGNTIGGLLVVGGVTYVVNTTNSNVLGNNNTVYADNSSIIGNHNQVGTNDNVIKNSGIWGDSNTLSTTNTTGGNYIVGNGNAVTGTGALNTIIGGNGSKSTGNTLSGSSTQNFVAGYDNTLGANLSTNDIIATDGNVSANVQNGVLIGEGGTLGASNAVAVGTGAQATFTNDIAIGTNAQATGTTNGTGTAIAIGDGAQATADSAISIGTGNQVSGKNSTAIGDPNAVSGTGDSILGNNNNVSGNNTMVVGNGVTATNSNNVILGNASADGTTHADAASQTITIGGTPYTYAGQAAANNANGIVSVGKAGAERQIQNVAAGDVTSSSTDAINGSQLWAVETGLAAEGLKFAGNTSTTAGGDTVALGNTVNVVGSTATSGVTYDSHNLTTVETAANGSSTILIEMSDTPTFTSVTTGNTVMNTSGVTIGSGTSAVSLTNTGLNNGGNTITNVAPGVNLTDAVNVSQLTNAISTSKTTVSAGKNVTVTPTGTGPIDYNVALDDSVTLGTAGSADAVALDGTKGTITAGTGINAVAIDGTVGTVKTGNITVTGGSTNTITGLSNTTWTGTTNDVSRAATEGELLGFAAEGLTFAGNTGTNAVALGKTVNVIGNTAASGVTYDSHNLTTAETLDANGNSTILIEMSNTPTFDSVTAGTGANQVIIGSTGVSVGNKIYITGSGINANSQKITNVADGTDPTDAVNVSQLKSAVSAGATVVNNTDGNITVAQSTNTATGANTYTVGLNNKVSVGSGTNAVGIDGTTGTITTGNTTVNGTGLTTKDSSGNTTTVSGNGVTIKGAGANGKTVTINSDNVDMGGNQIHSVAAGTASTDAVNVSQLNSAVAGATTTVSGDKNVKVTGTKQADGHTDYNVALNDTVTLGSGSNAVKMDGTTGTITAGTGDNAVSINGTNGTISAGTKVSLDGVNGKATIGNVTINGSGSTGTVNGLTNKTWNPDSITSGQAATEDQLKVVDKETVHYDTNSDGTVNYNKVTMGGGTSGTTITNVAPGKISSTSTDAVNGSQLYGVEQNVVNQGNQINKLGDRVDKVGAGAAALAALHPLDFDPDDKWDFALGYGHYDGQGAVATGMFYRPNEDTMFSIGYEAGNGENMWNAGVTLKLGSGNHVTTSRIAMAKEIVDLHNEVDQLKGMVSSLLGTIDDSKSKAFPDVPENHWAYEYVSKLAGNGVVEGYPDGTFKGNQTMTRYEFAAMLYRAMQKGATIDGRLLNEFKPELDRIRVDTISTNSEGTPTIQRVRVIPGRG